MGCWAAWAASTASTAMAGRLLRRSSSANFERDIGAIPPMPGIKDRRFVYPGRPVCVGRWDAGTQGGKGRNGGIDCEEGKEFGFALGSWS